MGFSQHEVRERLRLESISMISRWERGITMPSGENLLKLSLLYKTLVNQLYYELSKELQIELFPEERKTRAQKSKCRRLDRGP